MIRAEEDRLAAQLVVARRLGEVVSLLRNQKHGSRGPARIGSIVEAGGRRYFLSIPAGRTEIGGVTYYCISPGSPVGKALTGRSVGDRIRLPGGDEVTVKFLI